MRESRDRARALQCAQLELPQRRITINLAPADVPKDGSRFDLPIALGILAASGQLPRESLRDVEFYGELALTGELRPIEGALPAVLAAARAGRDIILPAANREEASLVGHPGSRFARTLLEARLPTGCEPARLPSRTSRWRCRPMTTPRIWRVLRSALARRALKCPAGAHH